jgi:hypothetical protein
MNTQILNSYGIEFLIEVVLGEKEPIVNQRTVSDISFCLFSYLMEQTFVEFLEEEVLVDINNALQGNAYDEDGGGEIMLLGINNPNSTFASLGDSAHSVTIPTVDLKEILTSWVEFLKKNNLNS